MPIEIITKEPTSLYEAKIGDLEYGTVFKYSNAPGSVYIKINKRKTSQNINLTYRTNHSVAMNLKLGTLRDIHGSTIVCVLDAKLEISISSNIKLHLKEWG